MENLHESLSQQNLSPSQHLVDAGYIDTELLVNAQKNYEIDLVGRAPGNSQWQAREGKGFGLANFHIDWEQEVVRFHSASMYYMGGASPIILPWTIPREKQT